MTAPLTSAAQDGLLYVRGQTTMLGSDNHCPEEAPAREVTVAGFWIQPHQVTNAQFAEFVEATGYLTVAERPLEPADHPVVHVAYEDAHAYAQWAGLSLPNEAEWETAARGGLARATYTWGDEPEEPQGRLANYWHGDFPWRPQPGYGRTTPVGSFAPNGYGLFDMAGNVWEWTTDWYTDTPANGACSEAGSSDPSQPQFTVPRRVIKGGSYLCADVYCLRYRPAARRAQAVDTGMSHIGFRCIRPA